MKQFPFHISKSKARRKKMNTKKPQNPSFDLRDKKSQLKDCFPLHFCFPLLLSAYFYYFTFFLSHFSSSHHKRKQPTMWISFIGWLVYYHIISNIDLYAHTHSHSHSYILTLFLYLFHSFHSLCYSLSLSRSPKPIER